MAITTGHFFKNLESSSVYDPRMRLDAGFVNEFIRDVKNIDPSVKGAMFRKGGLTEGQIKKLIQRPAVEVPETIAALDDGEYQTWGFDRFQKYITSGLTALQSGQVAVCLLAGGEPSFTTPVKECGGVSLLALRLMHCMDAKHLWVMTTPSMRDNLDKHMVGISMANKERIKVFEQYEMPALTPMNNVLFSTKGVPMTMPCGTGDSAQAMLDSGLLDEFIASGGKYVLFLNLNNVAAGIDPTIIGHHIEKSYDASSVVTERKPKDVGSTLLWADGAKTFIEDQRLPEEVEIDKEEGMLIDTGTLLINACELKNAGLVSWRYLRTRLEIEKTMMVCYRRNNSQWLENLTNVTHINMPRQMCYKPLR